MPAPHTPKQNRLLAALPRAEFERLQPHLEPLPLELGLPIYEAGQPVQYVYFPADCIISLLYVMENGDSAEIAVVGNEGVAGIASFMGGDTTPSRALVQSAGNAYRLFAEVLRTEFARGARCRSCCSATRRRSWRRWHRPRCATGTTRWRSSSAAGCC